MKFKKKERKKKKMNYTITYKKKKISVSGIVIFFSIVLVWSFGFSALEIYGF